MEYQCSGLNKLPLRSLRGISPNLHIISIPLHRSCTRGAGKARWAVFNADGSGELQATFCYHLLGGPGGAGHEDLEITAWSVDAATGFLRIDAASDSSFAGDTPIPATPGHYRSHPAPGVATEIQVTKIPGS